MENPLQLSQTHIGLSSLPEEVLLEIFRRCDGKSLVVCKRVCSYWKDLIHYLEKKVTFWYDNCQKDIPVGVQLDVLDKVFPSHWKNQSKVDWQEIYKCWSTWDDLKKCSLSARKFTSGLKGISCVKISGEWMLVSTFEGRGKLHGYNLKTGGEYELYSGGGSIFNIELVTCENEDCDDKGIMGEIFNTLDCNEIWLELRECYKVLQPNNVITLNKIGLAIRHSYGYQMKLFYTPCSISLLYLHKTCSKVNGPDQMEVELPQTYDTFLDFWMNKVSLCWSPLSSSRCRVDTITIDKKTQAVSRRHNFNLSNISTSPNIYSWQASLLIALIGESDIVIELNGKWESQITPPRSPCVTAALFYNNHLFLGTDRGHLLIYKLNKPEDILSVKVFLTKPTYTIQIELEKCVKVIHLAVVEPSNYNGKRPMIACTTPEEIYLVSFQE